MEKYTIKQIQAVLNNPNDFPPQMVSRMLLAHCFTFGDLEKHGLDAQQLAKLKMGHYESYYIKCLWSDTKYVDCQHSCDICPKCHQNVNKYDVLPIDNNMWCSIKDECFYECLTDSKVFQFLRYTSPFDYIDSLEDTAVRFAVAANLYAYIKKENLSYLVNDAGHYLLSIDVKHSFGRYEKSASDFDKLLLPCTTGAIPDLSAWINLLEYRSNCYPCMPDMKWWKAKGAVEVARKIIVAAKVFIENNPNSIFKRDAEKIIEGEMPELHRKLIIDMKENPEHYSAETIRMLLHGTTYKDVYDVMKCSLIEFYYYYNLTISINDLIINELITADESEELLHNHDSCQVQSIQGNYQNGIDIWITGFDQSGKTSLTNSLHYILFKKGIPAIKQSEYIKNYLFGVFETISHRRPPKSNTPQSTTNIQYVINKRITPINIIDEGNNNVLCRHISNRFLDKDIPNKDILPQGMDNGNKKLLCITIDASLFGRKESDYFTQRKRFHLYYLYILLDLLEKMYLSGNNNKKKIAENLIGLIVIFTKSDKASTIDDTVLDNIVNRCRSFCKKWNICKKNEYKPYIVYYSAGKNMIGDLFRYDFSDAIKLYDLIEHIIPSKSWWKQFL